MVPNLINTARSFLKPLVELIYPSYCGGCKKEGAMLCDACLASFSYVDAKIACPICGRIVGTPAECGECITGPKRYFTQAHFGFYFKGPFREALHSFKFEGRKDVGRALVGLIDEKVRSIAADIDLIVPLPVTEKRLRNRGFNQSFIISEEISKRTGKKVDFSTLLKVKETKDQYTLSKEDRKRNVKGAFAVTERTGFRKRKLLLVDDLYTTGSTAREASAVLFRSGAENITLFSLARTPL
jgi:competence protein ComFC